MGGVKSVLGEDSVVRCEDSAEGLGFDIGLLFSLLDNLVEYGDVYEGDK